MFRSGKNVSVPFLHPLFLGRPQGMTLCLHEAKKKKLCCPLPTDRKMRKNRVGFFFIYLFFFFFLMSDLGEEFAKICIQWLKKALA